MKCPYCGETMNCFREVKQIMANEGFDKDYLQAQIKQTIDAAVKSCFSENLKTYTEKAIRARCNDWSNDRVIKDAIREAVGSILLNRVQIRLREENKEETNS